MQIKECDLGAVINRDIARRVRTVNGITGHKQVAQNDLRQAAKLAALYDKKVDFCKFMKIIINHEFCVHLFICILFFFINLFIFFVVYIS